MPILHIIRGLPGAGKSTKARRLGCLVIEPEDNYATQDGAYVWRKRFIRDGRIDRAPAEQFLIEVFSAAARAGCDIAVAEVFPVIPLALLAAAMDRKYEIRVTTIQISPELSAKRNTHRVSLPTCRQMASKWRAWPGETIVQATD